MKHSFENLSLEQVKEKYGEWSAMAIKLPEGEYTRAPAADFRLRKLLQTAQDIIAKPLTECRVLDLACLEGHYGIEFAMHGSEVVAIEGREANLAKAAYAKSALGLEKLELILGDVRDLSPDQHGHFDIVICSGILYHLTASDACKFLTRIHEVCKGLVLIDTYISLSADQSININDKEYFGTLYKEHDEKADEKMKLRDLWASIDNTSSFWFTEPSLINYLTEIGFTSIMEVHGSATPQRSLDRKMYVALKGERSEVLSSEPTNDQLPVYMAEGQSGGLHPTNIKRGKVFRLAKQFIPPAIKEIVKPGLRYLRILPPDRTPKFMRDNN